MTLSDPKARTALGAKLQAEYIGAVTAPDAQTPVQESWRDFIYAEIWSRPELDLRSRFFIALAGAAAVGHVHAMNAYIRGVLSTQNATLAELREAALHISVYCGWSAGSIFDGEVTKVAQDMGLPPVVCPPIRGQAWDPEVRQAEGAAAFKDAMHFAGPPPNSGIAFFDAGILNFVMGEMWNRPGLDQRARRWMTLVAVGHSGASTPIRSHIWSAMASGNANRAEMNEFVLQYAVHAGWPRGSVMQSAVLEQAARVEKGLPFEA